MNEIDKKLYQLFSDKTLSEGCMLMSHVLQVPVMYLYTAVSHHVCWHNRSLGSEEFDTTVILGHEPQIHDVFRVANKNGEDMFMGSESILFSPDIKKIYIPCDPTLPLLSQSDETKQAIISLFE